MKIVITLLLSLFIVISSFSQEKYSKVKIFTGKQGLEQLAKAGIDITGGFIKKGVYFETDLSKDEIARITPLGLKTVIEIKDVSTFYENRAKAEKNLKINRNTNEEWPVPAHWNYGSMGGFYTLDEVMNELDSMAILYPDLISPRASISNDTLTHEGRKLWWVRISDNPNTHENEPEVLYTGVHHAREPMSVQQMIWYMWYLLENYNTNADIHSLINNTEMYFVPVVNPDGYEYNHTTNPNGGGMWRKNRRDNGDGTVGVDPNRNYGFEWGYDNNGSSPYTGDETYRGPAPFSEPCIKNMRDFSNNHEFKLALNYHSYSNLLLYPWGYTSNVTPDNDILHAFATLMTQENNYTFGPSSTTIYPTNGDANDWMYGEQNTKDKILSYTPEIGSSTDGFWPPISRIIPLCRDEMWQNITAARLVGKYATITNRSPIVTNQIDNYAYFEIQRLGLTDCPDFKVFIEPLDDNIVATGDTLHFYNMNILDTDFDSIPYSLRPNIESGTKYKYLLSVFNGDYIVSDTITKYFGTELVIFSDSCENMNNWSSSKWNITAGSYHSPNHSITDSPYGNYQNNTTAIIVLDTVIDLRNTPVAFLRFWAKWHIETGFDYVQVLVKDINENDWTPLSGKYTKKGTSNQAEGEPLYDGLQNNWVQEEIVLNGFTGKQINLRFVLKSDTYVTYDGFYFDDLKFSIISNTTGIAPHKIVNTGLNIFSVFPNPAKNFITISYKSQNAFGKLYLQLYSISGKLIKSIELLNKSGKYRFNVSTLQSGVYYVRISAETLTSATRKFIKL